MTVQGENVSININNNKNLYSNPHNFPTLEYYDTKINNF